MQPFLPVRTRLLIRNISDPNSHSGKEPPIAIVSKHFRILRFRLMLKIIIHICIISQKMQQQNEYSEMSYLLIKRLPLSTIVPKAYRPIKGFWISSIHWTYSLNSCTSHHWFLGKTSADFQTRLVQSYWLHNARLQKTDNVHHRNWVHNERETYIATLEMIHCSLK